MLKNYLKRLVSYTCIFLLAMSLAQLSYAESEVKTAGENAMGTDKQITLAERAAILLETQAAEKESKRIPSNIRAAAKCIVVFPSVFKAGLLVGGTGGQGLASCRHAETNAWGAPVYVNLSAASVGLQAGISNASIIFVLLDDLAVKELLNPDVKLGTKAEITAGPVGRIADLKKQPSVVSYVRTKGLFAGLDLDQSYVDIVKESNEEVYGAGSGSREIMLTRDKVPPRFKLFIQALSDFAPKSTN
jgi:lipid-binding SYLF domain-containing protein